MTKKWMLLSMGVLVFTSMGLYATTGTGVESDSDRSLRFMMRVLDRLEEVSEKQRQSRKIFQQRIEALAGEHHQLRQNYRREARKTENEKALKNKLEQGSRKVFSESLDECEKFLETLLSELRGNRKELERVMLYVKD